MGLFHATPLGLREPPNCPLRLRETPYTTLSGFSPAISKHTASLRPWKGGYPQLQGRGYHSFPRSSGDISISHLGVSRGHWNVPHTSHCLSKATPDFSGFRRPPSRLLYNGSFLQDPHSPDNPTTLNTLLLLTEICDGRSTVKFSRSWDQWFGAGCWPEGTLCGVVLAMLEWWGFFRMDMICLGIFSPAWPVLASLCSLVCPRKVCRRLWELHRGWWIRTGWQQGPREWQSFPI